MGNNSPWVSWDEDLREAQDVGAVGGGLLDVGDGLLNSALQVVPRGFGLDGGDFDGLAGHVGGSGGGRGVWERKDAGR